MDKDYNIELSEGKLKEFFSGKRILVTGGAGSIGREIVNQLLKYDPLVVRVLDNKESDLFELDMEIDNKRLRMLVGDVRDYKRIEFAMENIDIVFHAAALKHVPLCEYNPFEAIKTNVIGTQNIIDASIKQNISKVIFISTDKSVNAINVMGATKLLAERIVTSSNLYTGHKNTTFSSVRFGNVLNSRGSVVPVFRGQIKNGYITITNPSMTRFIMSIGRAVELVLKSAVLANGGEIFIFKMPALTLENLATAIIEIEKERGNTKDVDIRVIGARPGEKDDEELMTDCEAISAIETKDMLILNSKGGKNQIDPKIYSSKHAPKMSLDDIKSLLREL